MTPPGHDDATAQLRVLDGARAGGRLAVEAQHGEWSVTYLLAREGGQLVVAGVEVRPAAGATPLGGLPARLLRELQPGAALAHARQQLGGSAQGEEPRALMEAARRAPRRPGRRGQEQAVYAAIAYEYVKALSGGSRRPVTDAARAPERGLDYTEKYVREAISKARRRGLLTETGPGRPGGELTDEAKKLVFEQRRWWADSE